MTLTLFMKSSVEHCFHTSRKDKVIYPLLEKTLRFVLLAGVVTPYVGKLTI